MSLLRPIVPLALLLLGACAPAPDPPAWRDWEAELAGEGLLRTDRAPADAPFTNADLSRNFQRIAFGAEPQLNPRAPKRQILRRWETPVRWRLHGSLGLPDTATPDVETTFARIARVTGQDIAPAPDGTDANLDVWLMGPADFDRASDWSRALGRRGAAELVGDFRVNALPCFSAIRYLARPFQGRKAGTMTYALVLVRTGFGRDFRLSCFEEELAQVMGLANDDPRARPSIFNDDEEFALLTEHDEALLGLLYHPDLHPGMVPGQALPIVDKVLATTRPGG